MPILPCDAFTHETREICDALGLRKDQASTHSLRYDEAYILVMTGLPEYLTAWYRGWATRIYSTAEENDRICHLLANVVPTETQSSQAPGAGKRKRHS